jgi:polar amino acid transport system substrate-binding protein
MEMFKNRVAAVLLGIIGLLTSIEAKADQVIKIGFTAEPYPPFTSQDASGKWVGFEVELKDAICKQLNATCVVVPITWDGLIAGLKEGKIDMIWSSMSITDERRQVVDFTDKYYDTPSIIIGPKIDHAKIGFVANPDGKGGQILNPADLKGKIVGVQTSSTQGYYAQKYFGAGVQTKEYDTLDNTIGDLVAGRTDYLMADKIALDPFLKSDRGQEMEVKATLPADAMLGEGIGAAVRKGDDALREQMNSAISEIRKNGVYNEIAKRYFDFDIFGS